MLISLEAMDSQSSVSNAVRFSIGDRFAREGNFVFQNGRGLLFPPCAPDGQTAENWYSSCNQYGTYLARCGAYDTVIVGALLGK